MMGVNCVLVSFNFIFIGYSREGFVKNASIFIVILHLKLPLREFTFQPKSVESMERKLAYIVACIDLFMVTI